MSIKKKTLISNIVSAGKAHFFWYVHFERWSFFNCHMRFRAYTQCLPGNPFIL